SATIHRAVDGHRPSSDDSERQTSRLVVKARWEARRLGADPRNRSGCGRHAYRADYGDDDSNDDNDEGTHTPGGTKQSKRRTEWPDKYGQGRCDATSLRTDWNSDRYQLR